MSHLANMSHPSRPWSRRIASWLAPLMLVVAMPLAAQVAPDQGPRMVYLPSGSPTANDEANIARFVELGFNIERIDANGRAPLAHAHRVANHVRLMMRQGVPPESISVVGFGPSSAVATLASSFIGHRRISYVLLGRCDVLLKSQYRFRMSGRVLGVRDADDPASHSCRPLWGQSPKVTDRRDMVLHTGYGAALFDQPRAAWVQPVAAWGRDSRVDVGDIRVSAIDDDAGRKRGSND